MRFVHNFIYKLIEYFYKKGKSEQQFYITNNEFYYVRIRSNTKNSVMKGNRGFFGSNINKGRRHLICLTWFNKKPLPRKSLTKKEVKYLKRPPLQLLTNVIIRDKAGRFAASAVKNSCCPCSRLSNPDILIKKVPRQGCIIYRKHMAFIKTYAA